MSQLKDLIGIGIGPFNLSLAALSSGVQQLHTSFFEQKAQFEWHSELFYPDATMQTTYLKDLVTPVDPTNPYSFLNYLVKRRCFYAFLNTNRKTISRQEFEDYCRWVSQRLSNVHFGEGVREVTYDDKGFHVRLDSGSYRAQNICIGTGLKPHIPDAAKGWMGPTCFHAKSRFNREADLRDKRVVVIGGGQTGAEVFLNSLCGRSGEVKSLRWISRRLNLEALDESAFANDYFTPHYVNEFFSLPPLQKERIVGLQKMTSDGITPAYLEEIYRQLYLKNHVQQSTTPSEVLTGREMVTIDRLGDEYRIVVKNHVRDLEEEYFADVVILATGFKNNLPECMEPLLARLKFNDQGRPHLSQDFHMAWDGPESSKIYAVNFGRLTHGIAEAQTSLMAWRSATILNDLLGREHFAFKDSGAAFLTH